MIKLALVLASLASAVEVDGVRWNEQTSPHFDIRYRSAFMPKGLVFTIEAIHRNLEFNIGILEPQLLGEKKRFVLYKDKDQYLKGSFKPPPWSAAIAIPRLRALVTYEEKDSEEFRATLAHEMTHLFVGTYFQEGKAAPPRWLDEGLAMLMEDTAHPKGARDYYWENARGLLSRDRVKPTAEFVGTEPSKDADKDDVRDWYFQAYLMTRYLFKEHSKLQFKSLCAALRSKQELRYALRKVYGIRDLSAFDRAWTQYAGLPASRPKEKKAPEPGFKFHSRFDARSGKKPQ